MEIVKLALFPINGLHDAARRSYKAHVSNETMNLIDEATRGGTQVNQNTISRVAGNILAPSAEVNGTVNIVNGWSERRYRFLLETSEMDAFGIKSIGYYIGYTDYGREGLTFNNVGEVSIDPNMSFYVTSVHRLRSTTQTNGPARIQLTTGNQFLFNDGGDINLMSGEMGLMRMRPQEVFRSQNSLALLNHNGLLPANTYDFSASTVFNGETSSRRNNSAGTYLYDVLDAYRDGADLVRETGGDQQNLVETALSHFDNVHSVFYDPLFQEMQRVTTCIAEHGQFTYRELCILAPHVDQITAVFDNDRVSNTQWCRDNTEHWMGADMSTVISANLAQSAPAIMLENLIADLRVDITNMTPTSEFTWQVHQAHPIVSGVDATMLINRVITRIINEVAKPNTQQGFIPIQFTLDASIYGETFINMSFNGAPPVPYVMPTFADNGTSPVLTNDRRVFEETTHGIYSVAEALLGNNAKPVLTMNEQYTPNHPVNHVPANFQSPPNPLYDNTVRTTPSGIIIPQGNNLY